MACYTEVRLPKATPWKTIEAYVCELLTEKFGKTFTIETGGGDEGGADIRFSEEDWNIPHLEYFFVGKFKAVRRLQWSDNCFRQMDEGWFANWLSCKIAEKFNGMIYSESLGEKWKPTFHKDYPTPYAWKMRGERGFLTRALRKKVYKYNMAELKKALPASVYKVFAEK